MSTELKYNHCESVSGSHVLLKFLTILMRRAFVTKWTM